jgi:hypothetical protein
LYRLEQRFVGQPEERLIREALLRAAGPRLSGTRHAANRG